MGTYTGNIRVRDGLTTSAQSLVDLFNTITEAMLGCGMIAIPDNEITGQAGEFVLEDPAPGQTAVLPLENSGNNMKGFNWFRHPTLPFSVRVEYMHTARSGGRLGWIAWSLMRDGQVTNLSWWIPFANQSADGGNMTAIPARMSILRASCGADHFWLCPDILTNPQYSSLSPLRGSSFGLAVFEAGPNLVAMINSLTGPPASNTAMGIPGPSQSSFIINAHRVYQSTPGMPFIASMSGSLGTLFDLSDPIGTEGIRVSRGAKHINGQRWEINLGWAQYRLLQDGQIITANITGVEQAYVAALGFGSGNHAPYVSNEAQMIESELYVSGPLLPWAEGWTP